MSKTKTKPVAKVTDPKKLSEIKALEKQFFEIQERLDKMGMDKLKQEEYLGPIRKKLAIATGTASEGKKGSPSKPIIAKKPLGKLTWDGKYKGELWGLSNTDGELVFSFGDGQPSAGLARKNVLGKNALSMIAQMETDVGKWRSKLVVVHKAVKQGAADAQTLQKALPAFEKRRSEKRDTNNFTQNVNEYIKALDNAEKLVRAIPESKKKLEAARQFLEAKVLDFKFYEEEEKKTKTEEELKELKEEIEDAKKMFKEVLDIANKVRELDWEGLATAAIEKAADLIIDASYSKQLDALKKSLVESKIKMSKLKKEALTKKIESAQSTMEAAAIALGNATGGDLTAAIHQVSITQKEAVAELRESKSTAIAAKMLEEGTKQLQSIAAARAVCVQYLASSKRTAASMTQISDEYREVGSFLGDAVKIDPEFSDQKPYGKNLLQLSVANAKNLFIWGGWVQSVQADCAKAMQWIDQQGDKGPMGPFDEGKKLIKQGLGK